MFSREALPGIERLLVLTGNIGSKVGQRTKVIKDKQRTNRLEMRFSPDSPGELRASLVRRGPGAGYKKLKVGSAV